MDYIEQVTVPSYSGGVLIGNWNEDRYAKELSQQRPAAADQTSFDTTQRVSYPAGAALDNAVREYYENSKRPLELPCVESHLLFSHHGPHESSWDNQASSASRFSTVYIESYDKRQAGSHCCKSCCKCSSNTEPIAPARTLLDKKKVSPALVNHILMFLQQQWSQDAAQMTREAPLASTFHATITAPPAATKPEFGRTSSISRVQNPFMGQLRKQ